MKRLPVFLAVFLFTSSALARITFSPEAPTSADNTRVTIAGRWRNGCVPVNPRVSVGGSQITITLTSSDRTSVCPAAITPYVAAVRLGQLEPALYDIVVRVIDFGQVETIETRKLLVGEEAPAFIIQPAVVPASGGRIEIAGRLSFPCDASGCPSVSVFIDGVRVTGTLVFGRVVVEAPPHAPAAVTVTVGDGQNRVTSRAALRYYSNDDLDDQSFATILVPVVFNGRGAFGAEWRTAIRVQNNNTVAIRPPLLALNSFCPDPAVIGPPIPCSTELAARTTAAIEVPNHTRGLLLHVPIAEAQNLSFTATVRDVSRTAISYGTELPIVRDDDFRATRLDFMDIPFGDARYRVRLRIFAIGTDAARVSYTTLRGNDAVRSVFLSLQRAANDEPAFAEVDLSVIAGNLVPNRLAVFSDFAEPIWAFVSITNNETQQVTIVRPQ